MLLTTALVVLAALAYWGNSMTMLASVGGIAVALWLTDSRPTRTAAASVVAAAVLTSVTAETLHALYHALKEDPADHGGFWMSAFLVGLINAAAILPVLWLSRWRRDRAQARNPVD